MPPCAHHKHACCALLSKCMSAFLGCPSQKKKEHKPHPSPAHPSPAARPHPSPAHPSPAHPSPAARPHPSPAHPAPKPNAHCTCEAPGMSRVQLLADPTCMLLYMPAAGQSVCWHPSPLSAVAWSLPHDTTCQPAATNSISRLPRLTTSLTHPTFLQTRWCTATTCSRSPRTWVLGAVSVVRSDMLPQHRAAVGLAGKRVQLRREREPLSLPALPKPPLPPNHTSGNIQCTEASVSTGLPLPRSMASSWTSCWSSTRS